MNAAIATKPTKPQPMEATNEAVAFQAPIAKQPTSEPRPSANINDEVHMRGGRIDLGCSFCHNSCIFRKSCC